MFKAPSGQSKVFRIVKKRTILPNQSKPDERKEEEEEEKPKPKYFQKR